MRTCQESTSSCRDRGAHPTMPFISALAYKKVAVRDIVGCRD